MNRRLALLFYLLGLLLVLGATMRAGRHADQGPVYTVAEVRARLAHAPETVVGRTLWVRGVADTCAVWVVVDHPLCARWETSLRDAGDAPGNAWLPLLWSPRDAISSLLRRVPVLGTLLPAPRAPEWNRTATYRAVIRCPAHGSRDGAGCFAVLLDAAPAWP